MHSFADWNALNIWRILSVDCAINQEIKMWKIQSKYISNYALSISAWKIFSMLYAGAQIYGKWPK